MNVEEVLKQIQNLRNEKNKINCQIDKQIDNLRFNLTIENTLFIQKTEDGMYRLAFYNYKVCVEFHYRSIIRVMKVKQKDFEEKMQEFNGNPKRIINDNYFEEDIIIFKTKEDAEKALDWINSVIIMNKLTLDIKYPEDNE